MRSLIFFTTSKFIFVLMIVFSIWVLLRGHNSPGGGFIAGLITSGAFALYLFSHRPRQLKRLIPINLTSLLAIGISVVILSGFFSIFSKKPFLTSLWIKLNIIHLNLGSPLIFDIGVYLVIVSSILIILFALSESEK